MKRFVRLATTTALACLLAATSVHAHAPGLAEEPERRALTLDEVLALETFGAAALSPDGQWVAWERRRPYETAPRFDRNHRTGWAVTDLMIARTGDGAPEPLLPGDQTAGLLLVSWSPDSRRLLVHRLRGRRWRSASSMWPIGPSSGRVSRRTSSTASPAHGWTPTGWRSRSDPGAICHGCCASTARVRPRWIGVGRGRPRDGSLRGPGSRRASAG